MSSTPKLVPPIEEGEPEWLTWEKVREPLPPLQYFCPQLRIVSGGGAPHMIAGSSFVGKSIVLQSMVVSLCTGKEIWGAFSTPRPFKVAHIDLEQGIYLTSLRYQRLVHAMSVDEQLMNENFALKVHPREYTLANLSARTERAWGRAMENRDLIIIDTLRPAMPGINENDSLFSEGLYTLARLSEETGCRALIVHHTKKAGPDGVALDGRKESIRGTSGIFAACDHILVLYGKKYEPFEVTTEKNREGYEVDPFSLHIEDTDGRRGMRVVMLDPEVAKKAAADARATQKTSADKDAVKAALLAAGLDGLGTEELREASGLNGTRFSMAVKGHGEDIRIRAAKVNGSIKRIHVWDGEC